MVNKTTAIILAGGRGERMESLTDNTPKILLRVGDKPLGEHVIMHLKEYGITHILFSVCYLSDKIIQYFGDGSKFGVEIKYIRENKNKPLGTAGALYKVKHTIKNTFIVCAGDILRKLNISDVLKFHKEKNGIATICVYENSDPNPKSVVQINKMKQVYKFRERPQVILDSPVFSNASFYILEPTIFSFIPDDTFYDFGHDVFPHVLKKGEKIYGYIHKNFFLDVGNIHKLHRAQEVIKQYSYATH